MTFKHFFRDYADIQERKMSSTNRGGQREASDYYFTPLDSIKLALDFFVRMEHVDLSRCIVLDPCAGGDVNDEPRYPQALKEQGVTCITTFDIRDDSRAEHKEDYLAATLGRRFDLIISNPPFSHASEFIRKAQTELKPGGWLIFLLRLNYYGTRERQPLWGEWMPKYTFVQGAPRMQFSNAPGSDSIEYAHYIWRQGYNPPHSELHLGYLNAKEKKTRKAHR